MVEHVSIATTQREMLEPLIKSALAREKQTLALGIARTRARLAEFEQRFEMTSAEFERQLLAHELVETPEFTDWRMELGMLRLLQAQSQALEEAHID